MKRVHLVCNAHLDPYWLWEWEEGAAEAISTFRSAADMCEEFEGFIFNHNEVILYKWVEQYEPELFARIQRLVREGKWHIMCGWYLQPDCNMPSGESFVRQALLGKNYFIEKFGVEPKTAINFDPFGHTRGLVQILNKAGYDSYIHCRPDQNDCPLPDADYTWVGYDGSTIMGHRTLGWYGTPQFGKSREKIEQFLNAHSSREIGLVLWGVGNHGGGPSRKDLRDIKALMEERKDVLIEHSTPEKYFAEIQELGLTSPRHEADVNSWGVGCYTSQIRLKQKHRLLENEIFMLEKMVANAEAQGLMTYPAEAIHEALCDLMVGEFHDILPGSSIQPVEDAGIRLFDHGLEIISRLKAEAFFSLASGQPKSPEGQIPILAYNPHPYPVDGVFEVEFNLPDSNWEGQETLPVVHQDGKRLPCQTEQEVSNLNLDWRKRVIFSATLTPSTMSRFDCTLEVVPEKPAPALKAENDSIHFKTEDMDVIINCKTGLMDKYAVHGVDYIKPGAFSGVVMKDNEDPWGMSTCCFREIAGRFVLMEDERATRFSGVRKGILPAVRVIEDGEVRSVIEAVFAYEDSFLVLTYRLPKQGTGFDVHARVHWNQKDQMLKLVVPTFCDTYMGQVAYGRDILAGADKEVVAQKWVAAVDDTKALTCINDGIYGSDFVDGEMRLSLLRSPAYSGHPIHDRPIVPQDRYTPRIDQGERQYRFWFQGGPRDARLDAVDREALAHNEKPFIMSFYPCGAGEKPKEGPTLTGDDTLLLTALKRTEDGEGYIVRLFEPTGVEREAVFTWPALNIKQKLRFGRFEIKTLRIHPQDGSVCETDLLEKPV